jgi:hypothetical protein
MFDVRPASECRFAAADGGVRMSESVVPARRSKPKKSVSARLGPVAIMAALGLVTLAWSIFVIGEAIAFVAGISS